jgi:hypothetical protein
MESNEQEWCLIKNVFLKRSPGPALGISNISGYLGALNSVTVES